MPAARYGQFTRNRRIGPVGARPAAATAPSRVRGQETGYALVCSQDLCLYRSGATSFRNEASAYVRAQYSADLTLQADDRLVFPLHELHAATK